MKSFEPSSSSAIWQSSSATIVFMIVFVQEIESAEPSIRNSNLFPVKAKGDVRLRSVVSFGKSGRTSTPISKVLSSVERYFSPTSSASITP